MSGSKRFAPRWSVVPATAESRQEGRKSLAGEVPRAHDSLCEGLPTPIGPHVDQWPGALIHQPATGTGPKPLPSLCVRFTLLQRRNRHNGHCTRTHRAGAWMKERCCANLQTGLSLRLLRHPCKDFCRRVRGPSPQEAGRTFSGIPRRGRAPPGLTAWYGVPRVAYIHEFLNDAN